MKKPNFSGAAIAGFFANNGEKMVLGLMVFVLLCFLYGAITAKPLDDSKSPESIVRESEQAKTRINSVDFKESGETVVPIDFQKLIAEDRKEVSAAKLEQNHELDPRLFPELTKRGDPEIYPVSELQIASGYAVIPFARGNEAGGQRAAGGSTGKIPANAALPGVRAPNAETKAVYYTILTGLVPVEKEAAEYKRRFEYAVRPGMVTGTGTGGQVIPSDEPQYFFFQVERAELTDPKDSNPKWVPVHWLSTVPQAKDAPKWAVEYPEFVEKEYLLPEHERGDTKFYVSWPLPPVLLKYWGLEATHPKIPLVKTQTPAAEEPGQQPAEGQPAASPFDLPGMPSGKETAPAGAAKGTGKASPGAGKAKPGPTGTAAAHGGGAPAAATGGSPYRLFRFVDLTAEPGKTYRYRVKLLLANPNHNLKPEDLEIPESAKPEFRLSPWSEETAAVTVPSEARVLADSLIVPRGGADPQGKIYILTLLKDDKSGDWVEVAKDFELPLGGYASFPSTKIENVTDMAAEDLHTVLAPSISANQAMLLDVRNDEALGISKSKGPTEMLFIDSAGRIKIANSATDGLALKDYQQRTAVTPEKAPDH